MRHRDSIEHLWRDRPRDSKQRVLWTGFAAFLAFSCAVSNPDFGGVLSERRITNLERFISEVIPYPVRQDFDAELLWKWFYSILVEKGGDAMLVTTAVSILAISFSGISSFLFCFVSARTICSGSAKRGLLARGIGFLVRVWFLLVRAVPEYVWAFFGVALLGPGAAPGVFALGIHNYGVLGRLATDLVEDAPGAEANSLRAIGATESQVSLSVVTPLISGKFLALVLYRWETCLREASVLGLLGISSLGFWIQDSRARNRYDEMILFVFMLVLIVAVGEIVSIATRAILRLRYSRRAAKSVKL